MDHDFHSWPPKKNSDKISSAPIKIKENVWLSGQSVVLKGINIEKNNIVGFRSVVVKDCRKGGITVGNPGVWKKRNSRF